MAVTAFVFGLAQKSALNKEVDFDTDTIKVMLLTSTAAPAQDTWQYKSDVTNEVTGTGYTAGGATLANKTVTYTAGTNVLMLDNTVDVLWTTSTITARYAVFYVDTGVAATSALLCYWDFATDQISTAGTFTLTLAAAGLVTLTAA